MSPFRDCSLLTESITSEAQALLVVRCLLLGVIPGYLLENVVSPGGGDMLFPLRKHLHLHKMHPLEIPITKVLKLDMIRKSGTIRSEVHASCIVYFVVNVISYVM